MRKHSKRGRAQLTRHDGSLTLLGRLVRHNHNSMIRKILACFALIVFALSSSPSVEQFPVYEGKESHSSLAGGDGELGPATNSAFGFNRFVRAKFLIKIALSHEVTPDIGLHRSTRETPIIRPSSKYDVYQQMNVYRL